MANRFPTPASLLHPRLAVVALGAPFVFTKENIGEFDF